MRGDFCVFIPFLLVQSRRFSFEIGYCPKKEVTLNRIAFNKAQHSKGCARSKKRSDKS
nr:MAG TPA: hypothetical protein [Bacteriophage sp.]